MNNLFEQFAQENVASETELSELSSSCLALHNAQEHIKVYEEFLKDWKEIARKLVEDKIPTQMQALQLNSLTLDSGVKLSLKTEYFANISNENKENAYQWLRENGYGGLIKEVHKEDIHGQTLKAFVKESYEKDIELPESIKVYKLVKAVIK